MMRVTRRTTVVSVTIVLVTLSVALPLATGHVSLVSVSGHSMDPAMPSGSVALCADTDGWDVDEGDVVAIELRDRYIIHEVIHAETEHSLIDEPIDREIRTKGWNNTQKDPAIGTHLVECKVTAWVTASGEIRTP